MRKTLRKPSQKPLNIRMSEYDDMPVMEWRDKLKPAVTLGMPEEEAMPTTPIYIKKSKILSSEVE